MLSARRARFERCSSIGHIQITSRDIDILGYLDRHRLLRSREIWQLVSGSRQQILRRLQLLFHHGYVDRPRSQIEYFYKHGSHPLAYSLSPRGVAIVREHRSQAMTSSGFEKRDLSPLFLRHALQKSEIMVALELACRRNPQVTFVSANDLEADLQYERAPFEWRVKVDNKTELGVIPDDVFALEYSDSQKRNQRVLFFLESDRATMPVERRDLRKTSFRRKLLAYEATWMNKIHQTHFRFNRFRVLTITTSAGRVKNLVESCSKLKHGHGLFLFADLSTLKTHDPLTATWQTANGSVARLIDG